MSGGRFLFRADISNLVPRTAEPAVAKCPSKSSTLLGYPVYESATIIRMAVNMGHPHFKIRQCLNLRITMLRAGKIDKTDRTIRQDTNIFH
jgi:hypothetical protein